VIEMVQEFDAGEWIADGVLAALGADPEMSAQGEHIFYIVAYSNITSSH